MKGKIMFKSKAFWITAAIVGIVLLLGVSGVNSQIGLDESANEGWGNVEASYQRRADLIPNLVNTVKGYAAHEEGVLTAVTEARASVNDINIDIENATAAQMAQFQEAQQGLSSALSRLLVTVEAYPDLKADQQFLNLQAELAGTENRINIARRDYNSNVKDVNSSVRKFPGMIWAMLSGVDKRSAFEADAGSEDSPTVDFE